MRILLILLAALPLAAQTKVTLFHFSDYHSHALPFYTDEGDRGGLARAIGFLAKQKRRGALVFSGGDTINKGAPAWSDKYQCAEWPWFDGIVDAMAFGNHDADYGREAFEECRKSVRYPILSANTEGFAPYKVFVRNGVRIGVFALAGADFPKLVKVPGFSYTDPLETAREVVRKLREDERVQAVVMIGHQDVDDDYEMAKRVPGIDLIFGSHSHLKRALTQIPGASTWYISPSQYLTYISWVELQFANGKLGAIDGALLPVDERMPADPAVEKRVANMQRELEHDPQYRALFEPIGKLETPLSVAALGAKTVELMRKITGADVALSTTSSFRQPLPAGTLTMEVLLAALPYENEIVTCTMNAARLQRFLSAVEPESFVARGGPIDPATWKVATTDYVAYVAHKDVFDCEKTKTGLKVREELRKTF